MFFWASGTVNMISTIRMLGRRPRLAAMQNCSLGSEFGWFTSLEPLKRIETLFGLFA